MEEAREGIEEETERSLPGAIAMEAGSSWQEAQYTCYHVRPSRLTKCKAKGNTSELFSYDVM